MQPADLQRRLQAGLAGRYAVERAVGQGGSATVFLAEDIRHRRQVALKVLHPEISAVIGADRFLREIEIIAQLQHPHILPLYDSGEADGLLYYVMPFAGDGTLRHRLDREGRLPLDDALAIAAEVATALAFAHEHGIVHRDIKPENVLLFSGSIVVADFGIARALRAAGEGRVTEVGLALGTPLYMSPEQAAASGEIDGRSDQYSLACVVYEMLTGEPPFVGVSPTEVMARHLSDAPPALARRDPTAPERVSRALSRALAKRPADRFPTVTDFAQALRAPSGEHAGVGPDRRRWLVAAAAVAALGTLVVAQRSLVGDPLESDLYVVLPFSHAGGAAPALVDGDGCAVAVRDALARWTDVRQVDHLRLNDVLARDAGRPTTLDAALNVARQLRAGRMIWGELSPAGDSVRVRAGLYDVRRRRLIRPQDVTFGSDARDIEAKFGRLAGALLLEPGDRAGDTVSLGTTVLAAWKAYTAGQAALGRWSLDSAEARFAAAAQSDPEYAQAHLWLAHVRWWANEPPGRWREPAQRAVALGARLRTGRDSGRAGALLALADSQFQDACARYRGLTVRDSLDPVAWYGLAECLRNDPTVVRDAGSPSGWRYRTSFHEGVSAFRRALAITPSFNLAFGNNVYGRLARVLPIERGRFRAGYPVPPDTGMFVGFPALEADTLAFVPWPAAMAFASSGARPATLTAALERNRAELRRLVEAWADAFPESEAAHATLGFVLELGGTLRGAAGERSALSEHQRARALATTPLARIRAGSSVVRVHIRLEEFFAARALADTLLASESSPNPGVAERLAALAALRGRVEEAARLAAASAPAQAFARSAGTVPSPVAVEALRFSAYAAFGAPAESVRVVAARVAALTARWVEPARRERVFAAVMDAPLGNAFFILGSTAAHRRRGDYLVRLQGLLAAGDTTAVRRDLAALASRRRTMRPGDVALVAVFHEALLYLATGDTAAATRTLTVAMSDLTAVQTVLLDEPANAAALVRAMALRAQLAARAGDADAAQRWARAVLMMWNGADAALQPVLDVMQRIAAG